MICSHWRRFFFSKKSGLLKEILHFLCQQRSMLYLFSAAVLHRFLFVFSILTQSTIGDMRAIISWFLYRLDLQHSQRQRQVHAVLLYSHADQGKTVRQRPLVLHFHFVIFICYSLFCPLPPPIINICYPKCKAWK